MENKNKKAKPAELQPDDKNTAQTITLPDGQVIKIKGVMNVKPDHIEINKEDGPIPLSPSTTDQVIMIQPADAGDNSEIQLREENVQEILTAVPNWMIRWGNTLFCALILLLLAIAWMVRYPQIISTNVQLVNEFPAQYLDSDYFLKYEHLLVATGVDVQHNSPLMVKETDAVYSDMFLLKSITDTLKLNSRTFDFPFSELSVLSLGEVQDEFARFEDSYRLYQNNKNEMAASKTDSYAGNTVIPDDRVHYFRKLIEDYQQMKMAIEAWDEKNVVRAALEGKVEIVHQPMSYLKIKPPQRARYIARMQIPMVNSGKVALDQKVQVRLDNYPEMEFGILEGTIHKIKRTNSDSEIAYVAEAQLPERLITSYKKEIDFEENLSGSGDIIVKNTRLIEQFLTSFRH